LYVGPSVNAEQFAVTVMIELSFGDFFVAAEYINALSIANVA
jgi:hypothetical protein